MAVLASKRLLASSAIIVEMTSVVYAVDAFSFLSVNPNLKIQAVKPDEELACSILASIMKEAALQVGNVITEHLEADAAFGNIDR